MFTLHSPTARCPSSSSARVTIPTGFVKSTIQASGARDLARPLRDREHDGNRAQRLREPARAGRLLADAAALERNRLVEESRRLAADPDLDQDRIRAVERSGEVVRLDQRPLESLAREHPPREPGHHSQPLQVDVVQRELVDRQPLPVAREPRHELGRVGRPGPDDRDLHPLTPVSVTPSTKARWARKNRMITGAITISVAAIVRFHCTW